MLCTYQHIIFFLSIYVTVDGDYSNGGSALTPFTVVSLTSAAMFPHGKHVLEVERTEKTSNPFIGDEIGARRQRGTVGLCWESWSVQRCSKVECEVVLSLLLWVCKRRPLNPQLQHLRTNKCNDHLKP